MRLFGDNASPDKEGFRVGSSVVSATKRLRLAVSGLSLMGGSEQSTESVLIEGCRKGCVISWPCWMAIATWLMLGCNSVVCLCVDSEGKAGCRRSNPLTAVKPWADIAPSMIEYLGPEECSCSAGDRFSNSTIDLIESLAATAESSTSRKLKCE